MAYSTTISHEKRAQRRDEEDIRIRREERETYKNLTKEVYRYENYAGPIQETYDDVVANTLSLLRNMTLDERVHRMQEAVHQKKVCLITYYYYYYYCYHQLFLSSLIYDH